MSDKRTEKTEQTPIPATKIIAQNQEVSKQGFPVNMKLALLLGLISFIVYANTLKNGYTLDDYYAITNNNIVTKGMSAIPELLFTPYHRGNFIATNDLYRPLSLVMFAAEYQLFGNNPAPAHFLNVLLFICSVILLFLFFDKLFERKKTAVAFIAALLFAVHPIHTEVVANIKSRDELLCFSFAFLSLNIFLKYVNTGKVVQLFAGTFCFFLSLLSKETVITFLAVIPLIFFFYRNENKKRSAYITISIITAAVIFLAIRFSVLNSYNANSIEKINVINNSLAKEGLSSVSRIATAILILGYYLKLLFVPYPLICDYGFNAISYVTFSNPGVLISLAFYIFLAIFSVKLFLKNHKNPFAFGIFFFLITVSLFSNIPFLIGTAMGERLLFFPSAGFCFLIALMMERVAGRTNESNLSIIKNKKILGMLIPVMLVFIVITINRNSEWLNNYTLYTTDIKSSPQSGKLNLWLGLELITNIEKEEKDTSKQKEIRNEGIDYLRKSIAIYPDIPIAHAGLCDAYFRMGQYDSAEVHGIKAISLDPNSVLTLKNLGGIYFIKKDYTKAIEMSRKQIKLKTDSADPYANIAACFLSLGKVDSGIYYLNESILVDPTYNRSFEFLSMAYKSIGKTDSSKKYEAIAQKMNPGFKL